MKDSNTGYTEELNINTSDDIAVVQTTFGKVRGYIRGDISVFKGIPYGKAERFMPPENPDAWEGMRSCLSYGHVCPPSAYPVFEDEFAFAFQMNLGISSENCLNLNIWSSNSENKRKPVMVWLHGGGFSSGSALEFPSIDGENLSRSGEVVVVSFHHRLNLLGFLDLSVYGERYRYSANAGMLDMVKALEWVKENIASFGGDPSNVTIFGQSGGGTKVMALMNAPSAKGLFHKAIVQSGSSLTRIMEPRVAQKVSAAVLKELRLEVSQVSELESMAFERLEAAGKKALASVQETLSLEEYSIFGLEWEPVWDNDFFPNQPDEPEALALSNDIPLLVGSCKNEFIPFERDLRKVSSQEMNVILSEKYGEKAGNYLAALKIAYPETEQPGDFIGVDFLFRPLVVKHADQKSMNGTAPVFTYLFAWQSPVLDGLFRAFHCMDLPFVFNNITRCEEMTGGSENAVLLAEKVSAAWVQFAKTGNPAHEKLPAWPAYFPENGYVMIFDDNCVLKQHHDKELLGIVADR